MEEIWKDLEGYENLYKISNTGKIWSCRQNKEMKLSIRSGGYSSVNLTKNGERKTFYVHRLVALTFIDNPNNFEEVGHIVPVLESNDNSVSNLKWISKEKNLEQREEDGNRLRAYINSRGKKILQINPETGETIAEYPTMAEAGRITGIDKANIRKAANGIYSQMGGYIWRFKE